MPNTKQEKLLKNLEIIIFWLIWLIVYISPIFAQNNNETIDWKPIFSNWVRFLPFVIISALNHFILVPLLFFKKRTVVYGICAVLMVILSVYLIQNLQETENINSPRMAQREFRQMPPPHERQHPPFFDDGQKKPNKAMDKRGRNLPGIPPHINIGFIILLMLGFDTGLLAIFKLTQSEQKRTKLEKEHLNTQLAFLRNQVSPHFFMNTLNNIHALIDIDGEEAKSAIIQLSKLMRHLLYESESEQIPLKSEIKFIHHFIDLMRLRFTEKVDIQFNVTKPLPDCTIPPLLFTSFLENAFKHGVSYQTESFIHVNVTVADSKLVFKIENSNPKLSKDDDSSGIGLENSIKRLNLLYKNNYTLKTSDQSDMYSIKLILPL